MCDGIECTENYATWMRIQGWSPNTLVHRLGTIGRLIKAGLDDPCQVTTSQMIREIDRPMASATRSAYVSSLLSFGSWLVAAGLREVNPAAGLRRPRSQVGIPRPVGEEDLARALDGADRRGTAMLLLGAYAGLRLHEIAKVRGEDVQADGIYVLGKGGKRAVLPTHPRLWACAQLFPREGYWFPSPKQGNAISRHMAYLIIKGALAQAGVKATPHQLRHRYGTAVLRASGGNLLVAQQLLRHSNVATTQIYCLVDDTDKRDAVLALR